MACLKLIMRQRRRGRAGGGPASSHLHQRKRPGGGLEAASVAPGTMGSSVSTANAIAAAASACRVSPGGVTISCTARQH